eukprot:TRINITY_DN522_c0_g1_i2.p1 TRINITY_DN522_c0_g1~~TRINITY_DN522_c0_g1_i2.p1  ORF type:complete len:432 (-),score=69.26 TRINITY_DN522_c0_g1_i2:119-1414(-)
MVSARILHQKELKRAVIPSDSSVVQVHDIVRKLFNLPRNFTFHIRWMNADQEFFIMDKESVLRQAIASIDAKPSASIHLFVTPGSAPSVVGTRAGQLNHRPTSQSFDEPTPTTRAPSTQKVNPVRVVSTQRHGAPAMSAHRSGLEFSTNTSAGSGTQNMRSQSTSSTRRPASAPLVQIPATAHIRTQPSSSLVHAQTTQNTGNTSTLLADISSIPRHSDLSNGQGNFLHDEENASLVDSQHDSPRNIEPNSVYSTRQSGPSDLVEFMLNRNRLVQWCFLNTKYAQHIRDLDEIAEQQLYNLWTAVSSKRQELAEQKRRLKKEKRTKSLQYALELQATAIETIEGNLERFYRDYYSFSRSAISTLHKMPTSGVVVNTPAVHQELSEITAILSHIRESLDQSGVSGQIHILADAFQTLESGLSHQRQDIEKVC